ncbi:hypothetical protein GQ44DRAFT_704771 [Phaeosphaeriaceae sp. PMI808]|nr:hypothetical protein GQ44DRAFT_704771 [Phaeosphaeriaceae sp. PMI808]
MVQSAIEPEACSKPADMNENQSAPNNLPAQLFDKNATIRKEQTSKEEPGQKSPLNNSVQTESASSRKRSLPSSATTEEPTSKKAKEASLNGHGMSEIPRVDSPAEISHAKINTETWQGFCEIESEPAYFSTILREMGVEHVTVREPFGVSSDLLAMLPQPIYGLVLLFRYRPFGNEDQETKCPADVWFANQLPAQNSCGTLAMINILMNNPEIHVGDHLNQFRDFTKDMTPFQRGEAFASFEFVKKIHNSFAKQMDVLENDKYISYKFKQSQYLKTLESKHEPKATSSQARRRSRDSAATDDSAEAFENNAHHFIAFVPVGNEIWKLDGMDAQPTSVGTFNPEDGETWLSNACDTITTLMGAGDDDYGVVALVQSPLHSLRKKASLIINTTMHVESRLNNLSPTWREFVADNQEPTSPRMLGVEQHLSLHPITEAVRAEIDSEETQKLRERRESLVTELVEVAKSIMEEMGLEAAEEQKAMQRRYDTGPAIKKWLEMLAENGHLEANLSRFMFA